MRRDFRFCVGSTAWGRIYLARLVWTLCKLPLSKDAGKSADLLLFFDVERLDAKLEWMGKA